MFPFGSLTLSRNSAEKPANLSLSNLLGGEILRPSQSGEEPRDPSLLSAGISGCQTSDLENLEIFQEIKIS